MHIPSTIAPDPIRESWLATNRNIYWQAFLTVISGKPHHGQKEVRLFANDEQAKRFHIGINVFIFIIGLRIGWYAYHDVHDPFLLALSWVLTVRFAHLLRVVYLHDYVHKKFQEGISPFMLHLGAAITLPPAFKDGIQDHRYHHSRLGTEDDSYEHFRLTQIRKSKARSHVMRWGKLVLDTINPALHLWSVWDRIVSTLQFTPFLMLTFWTAAIMIGGWATIWVLGVPVLLAQFPTAMLAMANHLPHHGEALPEHQKMQRMTVTTFFGRLYPEDAWGRVWWLVLLFCWDIPIKIVFPGDAAVHDAHHIRPGDTQWWRAAFWREEILAEEAHFMQHSWGYLHCCVINIHAAWQ